MHTQSPLTLFPGLMSLRRCVCFQSSATAGGVCQARPANLHDPHLTNWTLGDHDVDGTGLTHTDPGTGWRGPDGVWRVVVGNQLAPNVGAFRSELQYKCQLLRAFSIENAEIMENCPLQNDDSPLKNGDIFCEFEVLGSQQTSASRRTSHCPQTIHSTTSSGSDVRRTHRSVEVRAGSRVT